MGWLAAFPGRSSSGSCGNSKSIGCIGQCNAMCSAMLCAVPCALLCAMQRAMQYYVQCHAMCSAACAAMCRRVLHMYARMLWTNYNTDFDHHVNVTHGRLALSTPLKFEVSDFFRHFRVSFGSDSSSVVSCAAQGQRVHQTRRPLTHQSAGAWLGKAVQSACS